MGELRLITPAMLLWSLTAVNIINQWTRYLPIYLASVSVATIACDSDCQDVPFSPICAGCEADDKRCFSCLTCRISGNSAFYNIMDGVCMSDVEYGALSGLGFSLTFCLTGILAGRIVDKWRDRTTIVLTCACITWSISTLLLSSCHSFLPVILLRLLVGASQAFCAPASYQLLATHFTNSERSSANGVYSFGTYFGAGLSSLSIIIADLYGWRATCVCVGIMGIVTSIFFACVVGFAPKHPYQPLEDYVVLTVDETKEQTNVRHSLSYRHIHAHSPMDLPNHVHLSIEPEDDDLDDVDYGPVHESGFTSGTESDDTALFEAPFSSVKSFDDLRRIKEREMSVKPAVLTTRQSLYVLFCSNKIYCLLLLAASIRFMGGIAVYVYSPIYVSRKYPDSVPFYAPLNAFILSVFGSLSSFVGGLLGSYNMQKRGSLGLAYVPAVGCLLALGPFAACFFADSFTQFMVFQAVGFVTGECWLGPAVAILQNTVPANVQGLGIALYMFFITLVGTSISDVLGDVDPGTSAINSILATVVVLTFGLSGGLFILLDRLIREHTLEPQTSCIKTGTNTHTHRSANQATLACDGPYQMSTPIEDDYDNGDDESTLIEYGDSQMTSSPTTTDSSSGTEPYALVTSA